MSSGLPETHAGHTQQTPAIVRLATPKLPATEPEQSQPDAQSAAAKAAAELAQVQPEAVPSSAPTDLAKLPTGPSEQEKLAASRGLAEGLARLKLARNLQAAQAVALKREQEAAQLALAAVQTRPSDSDEPAQGVTPQDTSISGAAPVTLAALPGNAAPAAAPIRVPLDVTAGPQAVIESVAPQLETPQQPSLEIAAATPDLIPVPDLRPRPLVRTKPGAISKPAQSEPRQSQGTVLSYANPGLPEKEERGVFSGIGKLFSGPRGLGPNNKVAIYDISASTVHMPDGSKLKANSGIGHRMNNPKYAYVKNLGPTPPNVYKLRMRERRFHGVEAIRMLPYDVAAMRGRDGMLAHSPLLRNSKGSHGCVAFTHYNKFLNAFKKGKVETMIVVPNMSALPKYVAMYNERKYASR
ncbi:DUF2778 domain-containing protein [Roseibium denhamense]|nr:DUF2778 domain-containing protein [Roseibium denhamense]